MTKIKFTQITSTDCELTKTFSRDAHGNIESTAIAHMTQGVARVVEIDHVGQLCSLLPLLQPNQAITCGVPYAGDTPLTTRAGAEVRSDAVARTNESFTFPNGPTLFPIDIDVDDKHARFATVQDALDALEDCHPWMRALHRVARPSSSSYVAGRGLRGVHVYFAVTAGSDIKALADRVQIEQWAKNKGWIKISKSGALLVRQISDALVYQPSRLMFESSPVLKGVEREIPIDQHFVERGPDGGRGRPYNYVVDGVLDAGAMPKVREIESRRFHTAVRDARNAQRKQAKAIALNYQKEQAIASGYDAVEGERRGLMAIRALGDEKLPTDWALFIKDIGVQTVRQVIDALPASLGHQCADPFDSWRDDLTPAHCTKAEIVMQGDKVGVWSHKLQRFFEFTEDAAANIASPLDQAAERLAGCVEYPEPMSKRGPTERNLTMAMRLLLEAIDCMPRTDATTGRREVSDELPSMIALQDAASHIGCIGVSIDAIEKVMKNMAKTNTLDPWKDKIATIPKWDGVPRLDTFFQDNMGSLPCDALVLTGQLLFAGVIMRQLQPGAQCPVVPVLIGAGKLGKTRFVHQLAELLDFPRPAAVTFGDSIKMCQAACVSPIAELAEMSGLSKRDNEDVKTWITDTEDVYRAPYGEYAERHLRRFVCIGTSNKYELNRDATGERRLFPVFVNQEILPAWRAEGLQVFAEARERFCRDLDVYLKLVDDCAGAVKEYNDAAMLRGEGTPASDLDDLMPPILRTLTAQSGKRRVMSGEVRKALDASPSGRTFRAQQIAAWLKTRGWERKVDGHGYPMYIAPKEYVDEDETNVLPFVNNPFNSKEAIA
jgi:hypothetical protein